MRPGVRFAAAKLQIDWCRRMVLFIILAVVCELKLFVS
jgi:hypothetical protein